MTQVSRTARPPPPRMMPTAILFDLFETLVTESQTRPAGVSSLAPVLGCERDSFRERWRALRPAVMDGTMPFRQALRDAAAGLGRSVDDATLERLSRDRRRVKAQAFAEIDARVLTTLDALRRRGVRLGVISNCCAEDVSAWAECALAPRVDCTLFSFDVRLAKPDPGIYREALRRLGVDASETWYIGDGAQDELEGAARAGLQPFKALWFLKRWPHYSEELSAVPCVSAIEELL
jgi:HAD superfamily hydrolase (TIGR01509 family)